MRQVLPEKLQESFKGLTPETRQNGIDIRYRPSSVADLKGTGNVEDRVVCSMGA